MINKEKNFISAVVYVRNNENTIRKFLSTLIDVLESNFEHQEIICVNDASIDNSAKIIEEESKNATKCSITLINLSYFHGIEASMKAGIDMSIGDFVYEFDYTFVDYDKKYILETYQHIFDGYDIVSCSSNKKISFTKSMYYHILSKFMHLGIQIQTENFRVISRRAINRVNALNISIPYRKVAYAYSGLKIDNIKYNPIVKIDKYNRSNLDKSYQMSLAIDTLILFTNIGFKIAMHLTLMMLVLFILTFIYTIITFIFNNPINGWTSTILFLSVAFFSLFVLITIVLKYLQIILNLLFKKKQYIYDSIIKLTK